MSNRCSSAAAIGAVVLAVSFGLGRSLEAQSASTAAETAALAEGWTLLARGDHVRASALAEQLIAQFPGSAGLGSLIVSAGIQRGGASAGLEAYERWLGPRTREDGYALRQVARAVPDEAKGSVTDVRNAAEALGALMRDGDAHASAALHLRANSGNFEEARVLAAMHNPQAINILMAELGAGAGNRGDHIAALVESGSPLVVAPLTAILNDASRNSTLTAAAADGLGRLGAREAIPRLTQLLSDPALPVQVAAASALFRLGDSGGLRLLQAWENSEIAGLRVQAVKVMAASPDGAWTRVVRDLTNDKEPANALEAARLIAPYDLDLARTTLERLMADPNAAVRDAAARIFVQDVAADFTALRRLLRVNQAGPRVAAADRILQLTRSSPR